VLVGEVFNFLQQTLSRVDRKDDVNCGSLTEIGVSHVTFLRIELVRLGSAFVEDAL
jgi:hypothetical protein